MRALSLYYLSILIVFLNGCGSSSAVLNPPVEVDHIGISVPSGSPFVLVDFGAKSSSETVPDSTNYLWNNYDKFRASTTSIILQNVYGDPTGIRLKTTQKFSGTGDVVLGTNTPTSARFPQPSVAQDYFWLGGSISSEGVLVFSQLPPNRDFTFVLYGAGANDGSSRNTRYTLTGATIRTAEMQLTGNLNETVTLTTQADENGEISLSVTAVAPDTRAYLNAIELILASPTDADSDGMPDDWEAANGLSSLDSSDAVGDLDNDGAINLIEYRRETGPNNSDSDGDGMPDGWEMLNRLDPLDIVDASVDPDADGYSNLEEYSYGFDPHSFDNTQLPGAEPTLLNVSSQTASVINLVWQDNSGAEDGFKLERQVNGGGWLEHARLAANSVTYSDNLVNEGETYHYRVAAYNATGLSLYSNPVAVTIDPVALTTVEFVPRLGHVDGDYGVVRYGNPSVLEYSVPAGHSRIVLFAVSYEQNTDGVLAKNNFTAEGQVLTDKTISAVSYGGVPLTQAGYVKAIKHTDGHQNHIEVWYMLEADLAKTKGNAWVVDWFEFIDDNDNLRGVAATYANVSQTVTFADVQEVFTNVADEYISLDIDTASQGYLLAQAVVGNSGSADNWTSGLVEVQDLSFSGVVSSTAVMATDGSRVNVGVTLVANNLRHALLAVSLRATARDSDQDFMPDYWEDLYGLDPLSNADASEDLDNDGTSNLDEYLAGTDPG